MVKQRDGSHRAVLDLREVNSQCMADKLSTQSGLQCIKQIQSANPKFFTNLDIRSAFYHIPYKDKSGKVTAFTAHCGNAKTRTGQSMSGRWQLKRLGMGHLCSPSGLGRAIIIAFSGISDLVIFADDILVYSSSIEAHMETIRLILEACIKHGIKLAPEKAKWIVSETTFVGFKINQEGIQPEPEKVSAMKNLSPPTSVTQIRQVLGMFAFFAHLIPQYTKRVAS